MKRDSRGRFAPANPGAHGVYVDDKGYLRISAGPHRNRRVATLVLEAKLGRKLEKWEDCHHRNGDRLDCGFDNLEAIDHRKHGWVSAKQGQFMKRKEEAEKKEWANYFVDNEASDAQKPLKEREVGS